MALDSQESATAASITGSVSSNQAASTEPGAKKSFDSDGILIACHTLVSKLD